MDGEQPQAAQSQSRLVQTFDCPSCGAPVTVRASGHSVVVTCSGCKAVIDVSDPNHQILSRYQEKKRIEPLIPLGQRGDVFGVTYEVIGFMQRGDTASNFRWHEYLLFNPYHGFRWLTLANGHWTFLTMIKEQPSDGLSGDMVYDGKTFQKYFRGRSRVDYVFGEFYWRVKVGDTVRVGDYISPPQILSVELDAGERVWSLGEYVEPEVVRSAFKLQTPLPIKTGVAPNQPPPHAKLGSLFFIFLCALVLLQVCTVFGARKEEAYRGEFVFRRTDTNRVAVSPAFELKGRVSDVEVVSSAPVQNNWLELEEGLVHSNTSKTVFFEQGIEFYEGSDSDGYWSEGKRTHRVLLSSVPSGTYYLSINPHAMGGVNEMPYSITVKRDVPTWSNFWMGLCLITVLPLFHGWRRRSFEMQRWADSDFSPYQTSEDEDESK